jgi:hypothetical protein
MASDLPVVVIVPVYVLIYENSSRYVY